VTGPTPKLLQVRNLRVGYTDRAGRLREVLRGIDLSLGAGQTLGLVGESGSGKSTLALAMMAYLKSGLQRTEGSVHLEGQDLFSLEPAQLQRLRGAVIGLVPQNAGQSLTPTLRVGQQIDESLLLHTELTGAQRQRRIQELLEQVRLPQAQLLAARYPHELSGGQQQRVAIAMALAGQPRLLLLDEPTTGLDVTTQAHVLQLLSDLNRETGTAMVYVSHDLGAIARVCERVSVLYAGEVVLKGPKRSVLTRPVHPYPRGLLASIARVSKPGLPVALPGRAAAPGESGPGCAFAPRCAWVQPRCEQEHPSLRAIDIENRARCHNAQSLLELGPAHSSATAPVADRPAGEQPLLALHDVSVQYARPKLWEQLLGRPAPGPLTVDGVQLQLHRGRTLALVGESGSGKSTLLKAIAGLVGLARGSMQWDGTQPWPAQLQQRTPDQLRRLQLIFQNPDDSLNPRHTVATLLAQPLRLYFGLSDQDLRDASVQWLERVRLGAHYLERLPAQMSGGEKQRVAIARAFAAQPDLVLCDEVTSALDVSVQAAVLELLQTLKHERGTAYLMVSHDLAVVRALADEVAVLYQGRVCEVGPAEAVYGPASHPYTQVLRAAVLEPDPDHRPSLLAQDITEAGPPQQGCPFQRRCPSKLGTQCEQETPPWRDGSLAGHRIRCHIPVAQLARGTAPASSQAPA
jgi:peptide/nickel transport system ATP-binding protein